MHTCWYTWQGSVGNNTPWHVKTKLCAVSLLRRKRGTNRWRDTGEGWGEWWWLFGDEGRRVVSCYTVSCMEITEQQILVSKLVRSNNNLGMKSNLGCAYIYSPWTRSRLPEWKTDRDAEKKNIGKKGRVESLSRWLKVGHKTILVIMRFLIISALALNICFFRFSFIFLILSRCIN